MKSSAIYRLQKILGQGAIGKVFLAQESDRLVALKFLQKGLDPQTQHFFKEEVKLLSHLSHPNLIQIYDFFEAGDHSSLFEIPKDLVSQVPRDAPCFVMEYTPGRPLDALKNLSIDTVTDIFIQSLEGLNYLHARNILHRDLKPSNLYWNEEGKIKILDFSVSLNLQDASAAQPSMGTLTYMPPEAFAGDFDPRSDLFSLAVVFYSLLSGRFPYDRPTTPQALSSLQAPVSLHHLRPEIPEYLSDLLAKMLELSPMRRPVGTQTILKIISQHSEHGYVSSGEQGDPLVFQKPPLVGRKKELEFLSQLSMPGESGPTMAILGGPAGVGRSRLLEEWKWSHLLQKGVFLQIAPPQAEPWWEALGKKLGDEQLSHVASDFASQQQYCLQKLREKFTVLAFSDLHQWPANAVSQLKIFLTALVRARIQALVVLEFNSEIADLDFGFVEESGVPLQRIVLTDLTAAETRELVRQAAFDAPVSEAAGEEIRKASGGRPLLVLELLRAYLSGRKDHLPQSLKEATRLRIQKLDPGSRKLLARILVHPASTTLEEVSRTWLDSAQNFESALLQLDGSGYTAPRDPSHPKLDMAYPSLKELWLEHLGSEEILAAHRAWMEFISARMDPKNPSDSDLILLIHHALGCGDMAVLGRWGAKVMQALENQGEFAKGIEWSERIFPALQTDWDRCTIFGKRAPFSYRLGKYDEALKAYDQWYELRPDDETQLQKARYYLNTGLVMFSAKRDNESKSRLSASVQTGDSERHSVLRPQHARAHNLLAALAERSGDLSEAEEHLQAALRLGAGNPLLEGETEQQLGTLAMRELRFDQARRHFQNSLRLFKLLGQAQTEAIALHSLSILERDLGNISEALDYVQKACLLAKQDGEILQWARYEGNRGTILQDAGDRSAALEAVESSWELLRILGSEEEKIIARVQLTSVYLFLGNRDKFSAHLTQLEKFKDTLQGLGLWDLVLQTRAEAAFLQGNTRQAADLFRQASTASTGFSRLVCELGALRARAWSHGLENSTDFANTLRTLSPLPGPAFEAWRRTLEFISRDPRSLGEEDLAQHFAYLAALQNPEARLDHLQMAAFHLKRWGLNRIAQKFAALAKRYWNEIFNSLPEEFKMDYEKNRNLQAFEKALSEAEEAKPSSKAAAIEKTGPSPSSKPNTETRGQISEERFRQFCEVGRQVVEKIGLEEILERVMDAAIELSRAERGFLILRSESESIKDLGDYSIVTARRIAKENLNPNDPQFSVSAVKAALEQGIPLLTDNAEEDARLKGALSVHQYQLKSILVVPLELEGDILGAIYLDHRFQPDCFTPNDIVFVSGFAAQAALAIQKAKIMEELKQAKLRLEVKVQDQEQRLHVLSEELSQARKGLRYDYKDIIGRAPSMMKVFQMLDHVTSTKIPVWVWGDSGTGKELIARSLHFNSPRKDKAFVSENCSAIPENLLESELFGHKKGAFTHAESDRVGLFEQADGGTLFLDEVADMSMGMQVKLLRVLQEGEIRPLGTNKKIKINVRLVTASNRDLAQLVKEGKFRQDLFYRINGMTIKLPPLKERKEDIPLLVHHLIKKIAKEYELKPSEVTKDGFALLMQQSWHGNIRELEGVVRNLLLFSNGKTINKELIQMHAGLIGEAAPAPAAVASEPISLPEDQEADRMQMMELFRKHKLDKEKVSEELGISLKSVYARMERFGIPKKKQELHQFIEKALGGKS